MNKAILIGRLTRDPDIRYTEGSQRTCIARYSLAVNRPARGEGQQTADYISCVAFGKSGEFAEKYLSKGMKIAVTGHIQTGSYTNRDGVKIYTTDVVIEQQEFCESKAAGDRARGSEGTQGEARDQADQDGFMNIPDAVEEDLPFH